MLAGGPVLNRIRGLRCKLHAEKSVDTIILHTHGEPEQILQDKRTFVFLLI